MPAIPAPAAPDPALAVIAKHCRASVDYHAAIAATDHTEPRTQSRWDAEHRQEGACHGDWGAAWELVETVPTTLAGVVAVLECVNQFEDVGEQ